MSIATQIEKETAKTSALSSDKARVNSQIPSVAGLTVQDVGSIYDDVFEDKDYFPFNPMALTICSCCTGVSVIEPVK